MAPCNIIVLEMNYALNDCMRECIEGLYLSKYKCLPNPYINREYVLNDLNRDLIICENK